MNDPSTKKADTLKGFVLLALSVLFNGGSVHLIRKALESSTPPMSAVMSAFSATMAFLVAGWVWRRAGWRWGGIEQTSPKSMWGCLARNPWSISLAPAAGAVAALGINVTMVRYGAETAAFLTSFLLVFLVLGGLLQGDRLSWREVPAILLIVAGAFLFSHRGGRVAYGAVGIMAFAMLCAACKQLIVRRVAGREALPVVMATNLALVVLWSLVLAAALGALVLPDWRAFGFAAAGGVVCSFMGMTFLYAGYRIVGVSRGGPLNAMRPLVVLVIGLALGTPLPATIRLIGGAAILAGSAALPVLHHLHARAARRRVAGA